MTTNYVCTHRDFNIEPFNSLKGNYKIITDGMELQNTYPYPIIKADNELLPLKHSYSEGVMIYDIWKNDNESDYIGINHYRRFLDIQRHEDNIQENVLSVPYSFDMYAQYGVCHNPSDLLECKAIIEEYYPSYNTTVNGLYGCNMAILDRQTFNEWCGFIFGVLEIFNERNHIHDDIGVRYHCMKNMKDYKVPFNLDYQSRLHGFLLERLSTIFFTNKFKNKPVRYSQIIKT